MTTQATPSSPSVPAPHYGELLAMMLTSAGHIAVRFFAPAAGGPNAPWGITEPHTLYNIGAALAWSVYIIWRAARTPGWLAEIGLRRDNFLAALRPAALFGLAAAGMLLAWAAWHGRLPLPAAFWFTAALYPVWGVGQHFALQGFVTRNLREAIRPEAGRALAAAALFSLAHFPNGWLMALVLPVGFVFSWIYIRRPNVWALGLIHGPLGALAYYCVLGQDPGAAILRALGM